MNAPAYLSDCDPESCATPLTGSGLTTVSIVEQQQVINAQSASDCLLGWCWWV